MTVPQGMIFGPKLTLLAIDYFHPFMTYSFELWLYELAYESEQA